MCTLWARRKPLVREFRVQNLDLALLRGFFESRVSIVASGLVDVGIRPCVRLLGIARAKWEAEEGGYPMTLIPE